LKQHKFKKQSPNEPSVLGARIAFDFIELQMEIINMTRTVTSLKIGVGETICRNKLSNLDTKYGKLMEKTMEIVGNWRNPSGLEKEIHGSITEEEHALIMAKLIKFQPILRKEMDFALLLSRHLGSLIESKRGSADRRLTLMISIGALLVAILSWTTKLLS